MGEAAITGKREEIDEMELVDDRPISSGNLGNWYKAAGPDKGRKLVDNQF